MSIVPVGGSTAVQQAAPAPGASEAKEAPGVPDHDGDQDDRSTSAAQGSAFRAATVDLKA